MDHVTGLRCLVCGRVYHPKQIDFVCPEHGTDGIVDIEYDYELIRSRVTRVRPGSEPGMWRYRALLPVERDSVPPPLLVGATPMVAAPRLAADLGVGQVWVKDEGRQPTGSLKDRASAMAVVKASEGGTGTITTASTGNAAAALAGMCAAAGARAVIFVPRDAPRGKIAQLLAYGASIIAVEGTYDQAFEMSMEAARRTGWYNRNTGFNPYMSEGKKTAAFEICESLGWNAPDVVTVSVGDGCIIGGLHKGFRDLLALGWIERMPRLIGVQAEGSAYLAEAWRNGEDPLNKPAITPSTIADSISAGLPRDRLKAMAAVRETQGAFVTASDDEILEAIPHMARGSGVFGEPAAAAAWAGAKQAGVAGLLERTDRVVVLSTGSGLKDAAAAERAADAVGSRVMPVPSGSDGLEMAMEALEVNR
ncbi:MAG TPA: threonine synthase [Acidimicrobiia bacterium]|nr:threonine synthase [Acidimicrobiia bacterium]